MKYIKEMPILFVVLLLVLAGCRSYQASEELDANNNNYWRITCVTPPSSIDVFEDSASEEDYYYQTIERCPSGLVTIHLNLGYPMIWENVDNLARSATHIVRAEVVDSSVSALLPDNTSQADVYKWTMHITTYRIRVLEVYKGRVAVGDIIEIEKRGGRIGHLEIICPSHVQLYNGEEMIFFLHCPRIRGLWLGPIGLVSHNQSIYWPAPPDSGLDTVLESLTPEYYFTLTITVDDLERIAKESGLRPSPTP